MAESTIAIAHGKDDAIVEIERPKPCVTYRQYGGRAAMMVFALELMGATGIKNYHKSR